MGRGFAALSVVVWRHLPGAEAIQHRMNRLNELDNGEGMIGADKLISAIPYRVGILG